MITVIMTEKKYIWLEIWSTYLPVALAARSIHNSKQANMRTSNVGTRSMKLPSGKSSRK
jgi:hypothetical protein